MRANARRIGEDEGYRLQRRALEGFVRMLGSSSPGAQVFEREGVTASIVPATPERSVINSVVYEDAEGLATVLEDLAAAYRDAGVRAWTVWVPESDRRAAILLARAGHHLDGEPRAMAMRLKGMPVAERKGLDWDSEAAPADVGRINDLAYGFRIGTFGGALAAVPPEADLRMYQARVDGQPASVLGTIERDGDCGIYFVATLNELRGGGLARRLLHIALAEARRRGCETTTLQATRMGFPVYQRLGYQDVGALQMWERRG